MWKANTPTSIQYIFCQVSINSGKLDDELNQGSSGVLKAPSQKPSVSSMCLLRKHHPVYTAVSDHSFESSSPSLYPVWRFLRLWTSSRPISNSQLHTLPCFHLCPIYLVFFKGSSSCDWRSYLEGGFTLRCLQRLSRPDLATLPWYWLPTDTPAVRPPRSSRTKGSSSQISCARAG